MYGGRELTYDVHFSFYFLFIFVSYFCFIFFNFYFVHFVFVFILISFYFISFVNLYLILFHFLIFLIVFFNISFSFISFRFLKWNQMKTTWPRTVIAPKKPWWLRTDAHAQQQYIILNDAKNSHILYVPHERPWSKFSSKNIASGLPRFHVIINQNNFWIKT